jgi:membrane-associated phospholipid phosphatase
MPELLQRLPQNVITIFRGRNLWYHLLAIILTVLIIESGTDWTYYRWTRSEAIAQAALPAILLGTLFPVFGILGLIIFGTVSRNRQLVSTGWALGQAALLGYLISIGYKAWTGRIPPPFRGFQMSAANAGSLVDTSHGFQLGFLKGGIFWGWPSSHTTVAFAMSFCLIALYPRNKIVVIAALLYAFYIGLAVSVSIHWLSEFVAGAIFGSLIGRVVGKSAAANNPVSRST